MDRCAWLVRWRGAAAGAPLTAAVTRAKRAGNRMPCSSRQKSRACRCGSASTSPGASTTQALMPRRRPSTRISARVRVRKNAAMAPSHCGTHRRVECRAVVAQPVHTAQRVVHTAFIHPVRQSLVRRRTEAPRHQAVETPAIGQRPDAAHGGAAVVQSPTHAVQFASVELPHQQAVDVAAEGHLLDGHIDMLPATRATARIVRRHRARPGHHLCMEGAGIKRFFHRRPIRFTGQPQCAAHCRGHELCASPARTLAATAECRHRNMHQCRIPRFDLRA